MTDLDADVVIIGSGPGGATAADALTAAGRTVIILEKGRNHLLSLDPPFDGLGHLTADELKMTRRHLLGPDPDVEPRTYRRSEDDGDRLLTGEVNNLPSTVGGGGYHADAKLPRFLESDFAMQSTLGPVEGAVVEDWPLTYADLEPHYGAAEQAVGVAGEQGNPFQPWRSTPYPMPPGPDMFGATLSAAAAEAMGLHPYRAPTGINSVPFDGRPACVNCGFCGHYGCPIEAKGDPLSQLKRALRTGCLEIRPESYATEITLGPDGRTATGVRYLDVSTGVGADAEVKEVRAGQVVLAAGAFETPRFLVTQGLANSSGLVGRCLTYHFQTFAVGSFPFSLHAHRGRDVTHHHDDFLVPGPAEQQAAAAAGLPWIKGGTVEHGGGNQPVQEALTAPFGPFHHTAMRASALRDRLWVLTMQGEDLPQHSNRIDLDPAVTDAWGRPAGRVTYQPHRHELVASAHFSPTLERILTDAGAEWAFTHTSPPIGDIDLDPRNPLGVAPNSKHVMGTCRMGTDPATSVVDPYGRYHDLENVWCADSSVFVTSTGYNPTLTICALAHRTAGFIP
jgi:choline dehydrogenase-like flavoprotein